jgi:hypothetical protein
VSRGPECLGQRCVCVGGRSLQLPTSAACVGQGGLPHSSAAPAGWGGLLRTSQEAAVRAPISTPGGRAKSRRREGCACAWGGPFAGSSPCSSPCRQTHIALERWTSAMAGEWGVKGKKKKVSDIKLLIENPKLLLHMMLANTNSNSCVCAGCCGAYKEEQPPIGEAGITYSCTNN